MKPLQWVLVALISFMGGMLFADLTRVPKVIERRDGCVLFLENEPGVPGGDGPADRDRRCRSWNVERLDREIVHEARLTLEIICLGWIISAMIIAVIESFKNPPKESMRHILIVNGKLKGHGKNRKPYLEVWKGLPSWDKLFPPE